MHVINATVKTLHKLEDDLHLVRNTLVKRLTAGMHNLCNSLDTKHTTPLGFANQSIVTLFETLITPNKKGEKQSPTVDAGDVQKLMLALPYLLDGLVDEELAEYNDRKAAALPESVLRIPFLM